MMIIPKLRSRRLMAAWAVIGLTVFGAGVASAQTRLDGEVVVKGFVRQKPVDAPPPIEIFTKLPKYEHIALSGDGNRIAFITTYDHAHFLVTYRFSDKLKQAVKLNDGEISSIAWADDQVLISAARPGLRGTCASGALGNGRKGSDSSADLAGLTAANVISIDSAGSPSGRNEVDAMDAASALSAANPPRCVYYGLRSQNAVTAINMDKQSGMDISGKLSLEANMPLGVPEILDSDGHMVGPFMELRAASVGAQPADRVYLWRIDPKTGIGKLINDGGGDLDRENRYVDDWLIDRQGTPIARAVYEFVTRRYSLQMKVSGKWKPVLSREIVARDHTFAPVLAGLGDDGKSILIIDAVEKDSRTGTRAFHYYTLSADGTLSGPLEPHDAAHDRAVFHPSTGRHVGFAYMGETETYVLTDPALKRLYERAQDVIPGESVQIISTAEDPRKMIIYAYGGEDPGAYYHVDFSNGKTNVIGEDYADIPTEWVASQRQISYQASDGLEIRGLLTYPPKPDPKNLPLIILPHDGPQAHDALSFDWLAQALASRGYLVLQPNYRGSDGYGMDFMAAGFGQWGRKMQSDLSDGVTYLVKEGLVNAKRVCVVGIGYGGYAALNGVVTAPETYACAASINGISDIDDIVGWQKNRSLLPEMDAITSLVPDPKWPRTFRGHPGSFATLKLYLGDEAHWKALSPSLKADAINRPVLLIHGSNDMTVPPRQSQIMLKALQAKHKAVEFVEVKDGDHNITTRAARQATLEAVLGFLAKNNPAN